MLKLEEERVPIYFTGKAIKMQSAQLVSIAIQTDTRLFQIRCVNVCVFLHVEQWCRYNTRTLKSK